MVWMPPPGCGSPNCESLILIGGRADAGERQGAGIAHTDVRQNAHGVRLGVSRDARSRRLRCLRHTFAGISSILISNAICEGRRKTRSCPLRLLVL